MGAIAIFGQGYMGKTHADSYAELGLAERIKYICTPRPRDPFESAPDAEIVTDASTVFSDSDVETVSICTPTPSHRELALAALRAGKNVLLEKPIALTIEDALAIDAAAVASGKTFMVAQVIRFFAGYCALREGVARGDLGVIQTARATRISKKPDWSTWWHDESESGGLIVDFSIHDFDQMNLFLGTPIAVRTVSMGPMGPMEVTIEYQNGGIGQVLGFTDAPAGVPFSSSIDLYGASGRASHNFTAGSATDAGTDDINRLKAWNADGLSTTDFPHDSPYTQQVKYFLECIENNAQPTLSSTASAVRALEVALAAQKSKKIAGRRVDIATVITDSAADKIPYGA